MTLGAHMNRAHQHGIARRYCTYLLLAIAYGLNRIQNPSMIHICSASGVPVPQVLALSELHLPLCAAMAIPGAVAAGMWGAARVLTVSLGGLAAVFVSLPRIIAKCTGSSGLLWLATGLSLLQGLVFPCVVSLQAAYMRFASPVEEIYAARALGLGALICEALALKLVPDRRNGLLNSTRAHSYSYILAVGLVGCAMAVSQLPSVPCALGSAATHTRGRQEPMLGWRLLAHSKQFCAILLSASAAGAALGLGQFFLPDDAVRLGYDLVYVADLLCGCLEAVLQRFFCIHRSVRRRLASAIAPILSALSLAVLVARNTPKSSRMPVYSTLFLFLQSPIGFGCGFGCAYREAGSISDSATIAALGSLASNLGAVLVPTFLLKTYSRRMWTVIMALAMGHQVLASIVWVRFGPTKRGELLGKGNVLLRNEEHACLQHNR